MSTKPNPDNRLSELVRLHAIEAALWPTRIARALQNIDDHRSPLHAGQGGGTDDEPPHQSPDMLTAGTARRYLVRIILELERQGRGIRHTLDEWAPTPTRSSIGAAENSALWCVNHLKHGYREPADDARNCRWCRDWHTRIDWPNKELLDLHARGIKITETIARRALKRGVA